MIDPAGYDTQTGLVQSKDAQEVIPQLVQSMNWKSTEVVLDFGCGSGFVTKNILLPAIQKQMPIGSYLEILGIDISESALIHATKQQSHLSIQYQYFDVFGHHTNEFEGKFDKIFAFHALHWIPETAKLLQRLYKMMKPGGEIGIYSTEMFHHNPEIDKAHKHPEFGECFHVFADTREFVNAFTQAGFEVQQAETVMSPYFFEHSGSFTDLIISTGFGRAPHGREAEFRTFADEAFKNWFTPDPTPDFPHRIQTEFPLLIIRATKS